MRALGCFSVVAITGKAFPFHSIDMTRWNARIINRPNAKKKPTAFKQPSTVRRLLPCHRSFLSCAFMAPKFSNVTTPPSVLCSNSYRSSSTRCFSNEGNRSRARSHGFVHALHVESERRRLPWLHRSDLICNFTGRYDDEQLASHQRVARLQSFTPRRATTH